MRSRKFGLKFGSVLAVLTSILVSGTGRASAASPGTAHTAATTGITYAWTGADGYGDWENPSNWVPYGVPGPNDTAIVGGAIELNEAVTVSSLQLVPKNGAGLANGGGAIYNTPLDFFDGTPLDSPADPYESITVTGASSWTAGTLGTLLIVAQGATLTVQPATGYSCSIQGGSLVNYGTLSVLANGSSGLTLGDGFNDGNDFGYVENDGTLNLAPGASIRDANAGNGSPRGLVLNNAGSLVDAPGATGATSTIATSLQNYGNVRVDLGTLSLSVPANDLVPAAPTLPQYAPPYYIGPANPAPANNSTLTAAASAEIVDDGVPLDAYSVIAGAGIVAGQNAPINAPVEVTGNFEIDGATAASGSRIEGPGTSNWKSGTVTGTLTFGPDPSNATTTATWSGGILNGNLVVDSGQSLTLPAFSSTNASPNYASRSCIGGQITNNGIVVQVAPVANQSSDLTIGQNSGTSATNIPIDNNGQWTLENGTSISLDVNDANNTGVFNNAGTLSKIGNSTATLTIPVQSTVVVNVTAGNLDFASGFTLNLGNLNLVGGNVTGALQLAKGILYGSGTVTGNITNSGGTVCPSWPAIGTLNVTGSYVQESGGTLAIGLAGTSAGQHGQLAVSGIVNLNGAVTTYLANGYAPPAGAVYPTISGAAVLHSFNVVNTPIYGNNQSIRAIYGPTTVELQGAYRDYTISGTVMRWLSGGGTSPVAGVTVGIWRPGAYATTVTDIHGAYAFHNLVAGTYILDALKSGSIFSPANATTVVPNSGYPVSPDSVVNFSTYLISGQVVSTATGNPGVANVTVNLSGTVTQSTVTDASGNYSFSDVPPGNYTLTPVSTGNLVFAPPSSSFAIPASGSAAAPNAYVTFQASGAAGGSAVHTGPSGHSG